MKIKVLKGLSGYLKGDTSKPFRYPPGEHIVPDWLGISLCSAKQAIQLDLEEVAPEVTTEIYAHVPVIEKSEITVVKRRRRVQVNNSTDIRTRKHCGT